MRTSLIVRVGLSARVCARLETGERRIKVNLRVNEEIKVSEVRLIGADSEQLGIVSREDALSRARAAGLDLCEIAANARPPVCKLMDFGKYKFELAKKQKEARKKQKVIQVKEVKISPKIGDHDLQIKKERALEFLAEGDKVKVTMIFRGRQNAHPEIGQQIMARMVEQLKTSAQVDRDLKQEGNQLTVIFAPSH